MSNICQTDRDDQIKLTLRVNKSVDFGDNIFLDIKATNISSTIVPGGFSIVTNLTNYPLILFEDSLKPGSTVSLKIQFKPAFEIVKNKLENIVAFVIDSQTQEPMSKIENIPLNIRNKEKVAELSDLALSIGTDAQEFCLNVRKIEYLETLSVPLQNGVYEKRLGKMCVDMSFDVSQSVCPTSIPDPPGFTQKLQILGNDPNTGLETSYAYIFWNETSGEAAICFTGTRTKAELQSDLDFKQVPCQNLNGYANGALVHRGFYLVYLSVRNELWDWWRVNGSIIKTLFITGHSLGGALSTLCVFDFADVFKNNPSANNSQTGSIELKQLPIHYSSGAPKCGNEIFVDLFNARVPNSIRIFNEEDAVPKLPPNIFNKLVYKHTHGDVSFSVSMQTPIDNHITAYKYYLPE